MTVLFAHSVHPSLFPNFREEYQYKSEFFGELLELPVVRRIPVSDDAIVELPDTRALRVLSRAGLILYRATSACKNSLAHTLGQDPTRVGLYCAIDQGPMEYSVMAKIARAPEIEMNKILRQHLPPKQLFRSGSNIAAAQTSIFLGIHGPMHSFLHGKFGALHAWTQAELDLKQGVIDTALVCGAFSLEDPLLNQKTLLDCPPGSPLSEGGAAIVLRAGQHFPLDVTRSMHEPYYGSADALVRLAMHLEEENGWNQ